MLHCSCCPVIPSPVCPSLLSSPPGPIAFCFSPRNNRLASFSFASPGQLPGGHSRSQGNFCVTLTLNLCRLATTEPMVLLEYFDGF